MVNEIFAPTGHIRCRGCDEIVFQMTDGSGLVMPEESVLEIDKDRLPENFYLDPLPPGFCPVCQNTENLDITSFYD